MIQIDQLNYAYGHKQVLKNINLEFPETQFSIILGRNGVGTSTLFKLLAGLDTVHDGLTRYSGQ
uniref:ATP-binding cassette domain-containing protein n=1 Tax=Acinetobacter baumannii TaxID=470 RepID=UPI000AA4F933